MKRLHLHVVLLAALASLAPALSATETYSYFYWTGLGTGWQGQVTPTSGDTSYLFLPPAVNHTITLPSDYTFGGVDIFSDGEDYEIVAAPTATPPLTLTLGSAYTGDSYGELHVGSGINLQIAATGSTYLYAGNSALILSGQIIDNPLNTTNSLYLATNSTGSGAFIFNHTGAGNTYTGTTYLGDGLGMPTVAFWNSSPFGTSTVNVASSASLIAHNSPTVTNNFTLSTSSPGTVYFRSWNAPLTLSGTLTLANDTTLSVRGSPGGVVSPDNTGMHLTSGAGSRHPVIITGAIAQDSSNTPRALTVNGSGILILNPASGLSNTYTGGTTVNGSVIFANANAVPPSGVLTVNDTGYIGNPVTTSVAGLLDTIRNNPTYNLIAGAIGLDTLPDATTITTLNDALDLTGVGTADQIRLGTATKAILAGATLTPNGTNYRFGNGGGTLYVATPLTDPVSAAATSRAVELDNASYTPLKLFLQGANTYTGGTRASNGILVFDGTGSLPNLNLLYTGSGLLRADGGADYLGSSYIGYTDSVTGLTPSAFLGYFDQANTWGIVGFDTHETSATTASIADVDLTGFNDGVYLGTATRATLTGTIKPTTVANSANAAPRFLRLTAVNDGRLTVNAGLLTENIDAVELGSRAYRDAFSTGTIVISPDASAAPTGNTYSGGTFINGNGPLTLEVGGVNPLGSAAVTLVGGNGHVIGLQASTSGYTLPNAIVFQTPGIDQGTPSLNLTGANSFTLSGNLSGHGFLSLANDITSPTVTLSGDNRSFTGSISILNGTLNLAHNRAAGGLTTGLDYATGAVLDFLGPNATVAFTGAATTPTLYGIRGDYGSLIVPDGTTLTFNTTATEGDHDFGGTIAGVGGATTNAAFLVTSDYDPNGYDDPEFLYLYGDNKLASTSTITVSGVAALAFGHNNAAGLATVIVDAAVSASGEPRGGLALNDGIVLTNPLSFNTGALAGVGTFAPSTLKQNGQTVSVLTVGTHQALLPGIPGDTTIPGKLTLGTSGSPLNVAFANGGAFLWTLQDPLRSDGYSLLVVNGSLNLSNLTTGGFLLELSTVDFYGNDGYAVLTDGATYVLPLIEATGGIVLPSAYTALSGAVDVTELFALETADFQFGTVPSTAFHVLVDGNKLNLSFIAVPEPGTYALFGLGLALVALTALRRRR